MGESLLLGGLVIAAVCALFGGGIGLLVRSRRSACPLACLMVGTLAGALTGGLAFAGFMSAMSFANLLLLLAAASTGMGFLCTHLGPTQQQIPIEGSSEAQPISRPVPTKQEDIYDFCDDWKTL